MAWWTTLPPSTKEDLLALQNWEDDGGAVAQDATPSARSWKSLSEEKEEVRAAAE